MSWVTLQWVTPEAEKQIAFIARGSNPDNQANPEYEKLFRYCLKHGHWSPFQMASMCLHFETSLAIAAQVKRHWSLAISEPADIQESSMRYFDPLEKGWGFQRIELRKPAATNRQSSNEPLTGLDKEGAKIWLERYNTVLMQVIGKLKEIGVANETLRMLYPAATTTRFFIAGSCRSWLHYFEQRLTEHAQHEHQVLALQAWDIFEQNFPTIANITLLKGGASVEAQQDWENWKLRIEKEKEWQTHDPTT